MPTPSCVMLGILASRRWWPRVYPLYQRALRDNAAVDFDDLLMLTVQLLRRHPDILERYQHRWLYIMVDEYQDTNMAQYHMLHLLAAKHRKPVRSGRRRPECVPFPRCQRAQYSQF